MDKLSRRGMIAALAAVPTVAATAALADDFRPGDGIVTGNERCKSCRFFQARILPGYGADLISYNDGSVVMGSDGQPLKVGDCRRFAPGDTSTSLAAIEWHEEGGSHSVWSDHICGEYRPRPITWVAEA